MTDVTQGNQDELRTDQGTIKDQTTPPTDTTSTTPPKDAKSDDKASDIKTEGDGKDKSVLNQDDKKKDEAKTGAPEKYEDFKLPDGVTLEGETLTAATTLFKELGLSQEAAQKLVDFHAKQITEAEEGPVKFWLKQQEDWKKEIAEDPKLGPRLPEIKTSFARMLDSIGDAELAKNFREAMDYTGAGNNPAFIRMMDKISSMFTEGKPVQGTKPAPVREPGKAAGPGAAALYPNLPAS